MLSKSYSYLLYTKIKFQVLTKGTSLDDGINRKDESSTIEEKTIGEMYYEEYNKYNVKYCSSLL